MFRKVSNQKLGKTYGRCVTVRAQLCGVEILLPVTLWYDGMNKNL